MEFDSALEWYAGQSRDAAEKFAAQIDIALRRIEEAPERNRLVRAPLRRLIVRGFPYGVYYMVDAEIITVVGVVHGRRNLRRWLRRARW